MDHAHLQPVDWSKWINDLNWLIIGGESQQSTRARPFDLTWALSAIRTAMVNGIPVFMKQTGSNAYDSFGEKVTFNDRAGADPAEWPESLNVREFPDLS